MRRIPELDALRGIAALAIIAYHFWLIEFPVLGTAVDLFFVLSGYLITTIILKHEGSKGFLIPFYARRALRIWPIYYLTLMLLLAVNPFLSHPPSLGGWPYYVTYTQGLPLYWFGANPPFTPAFRHTWTLAIEEQFYLVWPALIWVLGRKSLIPLCGLFMAVSVAARAVGYPPWLLLSHSEGLALGGLLATLFLERERGDCSDRALRAGFRLALIGGIALVAAPKVVAALSGVAMNSALTQSLKLFFLNVVMFAFVGLVILGSGQPAFRWLRSRPLCYLGQISYGIYLYHHVLYSFIKPVGDRYGLLMVAVTFATAVASWELIEKPILKLKDRFPYQSGARTAGDEGLRELATSTPALEYSRLGGVRMDG